MINNQYSLFSYYGNRSNKLIFTFYNKYSLCIWSLNSHSLNWFQIRNAGLDWLGCKGCFWLSHLVLDVIFNHDIFCLLFILGDRKLSFWSLSLLKVKLELLFEILKLFCKSNLSCETCALCWSECISYKIFRIVVVLLWYWTLNFLRTYHGCNGRFFNRII